MKFEAVVPRVGKSNRNYVSPFLATVRGELSGVESVVAEPGDAGGATVLFETDDRDAGLWQLQIVVNIAHREGMDSWNAVCTVDGEEVGIFPRGGP